MSSRPPPTSELSAETDPEDAPGFPSRDELTSRLEPLSRPAQVAFAARCALRGLPLSVRDDGTFPDDWSIHHSLSLPRAIEAAITWATTGVNTANTYSAAAEINSAANAYAAARGARADTVRAASYSAAYAYSTAYASLGEALPWAHAAAAATAAANAIARGHRDRTSTPPFAAFRSAIYSDLSILEKHTDLESGQLRDFISSPLFPPASDLNLASYLRPWREALLAHAADEKDSALLAEATALAERIEGYFHGRWDWDALLGSGQATKADIPTPAAQPSAREPLTDEALATHLARLAFLQPAALSLVSTPTVPSLQQALDSHARTGSNDPRGHQERLAAAARFDPDPLWLAWFTTTQTDFCQAVRKLPVPVAFPTDDVAPPVTSAANESATEPVEDEASEAPTTKKRLARKPAPKKK